MSNETVKETNPLFPIARKQHNEEFLSWEYSFLHLTPENENTYILGFCGGIRHASELYGKQIAEFQEKMDKLNAIANEKENELLGKITELENKIAAPTINRY